MFGRRVIPLAFLVTGLFITLAVAAGAKDGGRPFSTELTGEAEVTAEGVPNQGDLDGIGSASITLNPGSGQVCVELTAEDITLPAAAAHIHVGAATTTGPVVVGLAPPDADGTSSGCVSADRDLIMAIIQSPENYYVNVHTSDFPAGALRGQLGR